MFLFVGLGNPGPEYAWTRHNAGWIAADAVAERFRMDGPQSRFGGMLWSAPLPGGEKLLCLKPLTYMNLSGRAVREAVSYLRIPHERVLVAYDEIALPTGKLRARPKGSAGGHNGMASIIGALGTLEIPRLRIGIGPLPPGRELVYYVTSPFSRAEREEILSAAEACAEAAALWIAEGLDAVMQRFNPTPKSKAVQGTEAPGR